MVFAGGPPVQEPAQAIDELLVDLERLLQDLVNDPQGMVPNGLEGALAAAWNDVQPLFEGVRAALPEVGLADWERAGLVGNELAFKVEAANRLVGRARDLFAQVPRIPRAAAGAFANACGVVDAILRSLPPPIRLMTERIEEFKSIAEKLAESVVFVEGED